MAAYFKDDIDLDDPGQVKLAGLVFYGMILMLVFGGLFFVIRGVTDARECIAARSWPTAKGEVLRSDMESHTSRGRSKVEVTTYDVNIRYTYAVDGVEYDGDQVTLGTLNRNSEKTAYRLLNAYPLGTSVDVRYDPVSPSRATLSTELPTGTKLDMGAGGGALLLGLGLLLMVLKWSREAQRQEAEQLIPATGEVEAEALCGQPI